MTPAPQGANLLWILSGEQFSLYEKGKKDKKPPLQRFVTFLKRSRPHIPKDMRSAGAESVVCVLLRIPSQLRTFTGFFIRFRSRSLNCLNALRPRLSPLGELSPAPCHYLYRAGPIGAPVVLAPTVKPRRFRLADNFYYSPGWELVRLPRLKGLPGFALLCSCTQAKKADVSQLNLL